MQYEDKLISSRKINTNLLYLYNSLVALDYKKYPKKVEYKLHHLTDYVANLVFESIPGNYDISKEEYYVVTTYEKSFLSKNK